MTTWHEDLPVGSAILNGDTKLPASHPGAPRLVKIQRTHPADWPWTRLTGTPADVPTRWSDLAGWRVQPWSELGPILRDAR